jgi:hypothetical protein
MPARWADEAPERERPCKSEYMGESEYMGIRSVMVATATSCEGKCQPEGWLPPTGRVGGVSVRRTDGYPTQGSMPARRADDLLAVRVSGFRPKGRCRLEGLMKVVDRTGQ